HGPAHLVATELGRAVRVDHAREFKDPAGWHILFADLGASVGQGVLDGVGDGGGCADHAALPHPPVVEGDVGRRGEVLDVDVWDLADGGDQVVHEGAGDHLTVLVVHG